MDPKAFLKKFKERRESSHEGKEYFFALEIKEEVVKAALWGLEDKKTKIFETAFLQIEKEEKDLVQAVDSVIADVLDKAKVFNQKEPEKIIFGLPYEWVEGEKIKPQNLEKLKGITRSLDLKPIGFVVILEAIGQYLKLVEGVPPSVILLDLSRREMEVTLLRLGRIVGRERVIRSGDLGEDLAEGLSRIKSQDVLPARIFVYDSGLDLEKTREEILAFPWMEKQEELGFNFLHLPKIEMMEDDFDIRAVALAGGAEAVAAEGIEAEEIFSTKEEDEKKVEEVSKEEVVKEETNEEEKTEEEGFSKEDKEIDGEKLGFGFVESKEPIEEGQVEEEKIEQPKTESDLRAVPSLSWQRKDFGFPVAKREPFAAATLPKEEPKKPFFGWLRVFGKIKKMAVGVVSRLVKIITWPFRIFTDSLVRTVVVLAVFLLVLAGGIFWAYWVWPRAEVKLKMQKQIQEKNFLVTLDPGISELSLENKAVPGKEIAVNLEGSGEGETTGTKIIGEQAEGEVTIYNRTPERKVLTKGTVLESTSGLEFSLEEEAAVASESSGEDYTKIPGKAMAKVKAAKIGSEGNLAVGTEFEVGKYSKTEIIARNENVFSKGSSREVRVVAKADLEKLTEKVLADVESRALSTLEGKLETGEKLIEDSLEKKIAEVEFDKEVDQEAENLKLTLKVDFKVLTYRQTDFAKLVEKEMEKNIPVGFELRKEESVPNFKLEKFKGGKAEFSVDYQAALYPILDQGEIIRSIKGKKINMAEFYLGRLPGVVSFEIEFRPRLARKWDVLPHREKNIIVSFEY